MLVLITYNHYGRKINEALDTSSVQSFIITELFFIFFIYVISVNRNSFYNLCQFIVSVYNVCRHCPLPKLILHSPLFSHCSFIELCTLIFSPDFLDLPLHFYSSGIHSDVSFGICFPGFSCHGHTMVSFFSE